LGPKKFGILELNGEADAVEDGLEGSSCEVGNTGNAGEDDVLEEEGAPAGGLLKGIEG
jgi:hypothetical protein